MMYHGVTATTETKMLFTLHACPDHNKPPEMVMIATLRVIEEYLQRQVPRTFGDAFLLEQGRIGYWMVKPGAHLPVEAGQVFQADGTPMREESYLDRFPAEHRASADQAYQDGYEDGAEFEDPVFAEAKRIVSPAPGRHGYSDVGNQLVRYLREEDTAEASVECLRLLEQDYTKP